MQSNEFYNIYTPQKSLFSRVIDALLTTFIVFLAMVLFLVLAYEPVKIDGESMLPTVVDGEMVAVSRMAEDYERGDVVVAQKNDYYVIKRIIAAGGDKIAFGRDGDTVYLYVNDFTAPVNESYINEPMQYDDNRFKAIKVAPDTSEQSLEAAAITLAEGEIFLCGDNRNKSTDSRADGVYTLDDVKGKMSFSITKNKAVSFVFEMIYKLKNKENTL